MALELAATVHATTDQTDDLRGFVRASDVAHAAQGDSTGLAVVLAAMLRAQGIPARVAVGLVYRAGETPRMTYHVWTLAYIDGDWMALDATEGGRAAANRLTMATTNLGEGEEYKSVAPVLSGLGRMQIEIVGAQY